MIIVRIVCVGRIKEKYFSDAVKEYSKRLSRFCDFSVIETEEENYFKYDGETDKIKEKEGERIIPLLRGKVIVLGIEGKKYDSCGFAKVIKNCVDRGEEITFIIGGSYGLSDEVKQRAAKIISFSDMTFPHTLFRVLLTEQIYRAFSINAGSPYHK